MPLHRDAFPLNTFQIQAVVSFHRWRILPTDHIDRFPRSQIWPVFQAPLQIVTIRCSRSNQTWDSSSKWAGRTRLTIAWTNPRTTYEAGVMTRLGGVEPGFEDEASDTKRKTPSKCRKDRGLWQAVEQGDPKYDIQLRIPNHCQR